MEKVRSELMTRILLYKVQTQNLTVKALSGDRDLTYILKE